MTARARPRSGPRETAASLAGALRRRIEETGPIALVDYMEACLHDPGHGYYRVAEPLGSEGDFVTAPEVSQIFGELIGLWAAETWRAMGAPETFRLVELGPGRGTLMADALRASRLVPEFAAALTLHLVETSVPLRKAQEERLEGPGVRPCWHERLEDVPEGPAIVIANEFFDALAVRQFERRGTGWRERCVGIGEDGAFSFCLAPRPVRDKEILSALPRGGVRDGDIFETRPACRPLAGELARRAARFPLACLVIDYGHLESACGDTLQAVRAHSNADPLEAPGAADLTAHVDFEALARGAAAAGLRVWGPLRQAAFLLSLGLAERCEALVKAASPDQARLVESGARRLVDPAQMGALFKVIALTSQQSPAPPAFEAEWRMPALSAA